jgi:copper(I)-binding protein
MNRDIATMLRTATLLGVCAILWACSNGAQAPIEVRNAWSPAAPPGADAAAVYLEVKANATDTLLGASTPVAAQAEMHTTLQAQGMMQMRPIERLEIRAGESIKFEPAGKHFMLTGLRQPLAADSQFPLTLRFAKAGAVTVAVKVGAAP